MPAVVTPPPLARARSAALRELASWALPRSVLVAHGARRGGRRIALTFDDGPGTMTPSYVHVLARLAVRATFFLIGESAARSPGVTRELVRRGHEVGAHGWTHEPFPSMTPQRLRDELARTSSVLPATARRPMVRPPRGALSARALLNVARAGYRVVLWSVDSNDCRTRDAHEIVRRLRPERIEPGDVVLLHEQQPWTLDALPTIVGALRGAGFELVTVGELME